MRYIALTHVRYTALTHMRYIILASLCMGPTDPPRPLPHPPIGHSRVGGLSRAARHTVALRRR